MPLSRLRLLIARDVVETHKSDSSEAECGKLKDSYKDGE
jgi:hypothetical protein